MSKPTNPPFVEFETFPTGFVSDKAANLSEAQRRLLTGDPADAPPQAAPPPPPPPPAAGCKACGWTQDAQLPVWLKDADRAAIVDQMLFHGRFTRQFRLGPLSVTFRTLYAKEAALCLDAAAQMSPVPSTVAATTMMVDKYRFELTMAIASVTFGGKTIVGPDEVTSAEAIRANADMMEAGPLRAEPVRAAVRRAYLAFITGVDWVMIESMSPNF